MSWYPAGIGWNVETLTWVQITFMEAALIWMMSWMIRQFKPLMDRLPKILVAIDEWVNRDMSEADKELAKKKRAPVFKPPWG